MQTKEQKRASFALKKIETLIGPTGEGLSKEDANYYVGLPTLILTNGLGQSIAYLLSKTKGKNKTENKKYLESFNIIQEWLQKEFSEINAVGKEKLDFLKAFTNLEQGRYLDAQDEALALLSWFKRYARAFQKPDEGKQTNE